MNRALATLGVLGAIAAVAVVGTELAGGPTNVVRASTGWDTTPAGEHQIELDDREWSVGFPGDTWEL